MKTIHSPSSDRLQRRREAVRLHEIENNPLTDDELRMFEMFDREGWSDERRRAFIVDRVQAGSENVQAAE